MELDRRLDFTGYRKLVEWQPRDAPDGDDYENESSAESLADSVRIATVNGDQRGVSANGLYNTRIRHGFGVISDEWMKYLAESFCNYYEDKRHETGGNHHEEVGVSSDWRITDRQRTVNAALVLCLNLGVDPPDIIKTQPSAKLEAWINPGQIADTKKAIEQIGKNLQAQYESLSTRTKYKQCLDPNVEDAKRFCMGLRRSARDERILFHYNGHGVPRPTASGEIWVFNRGYTQYIPVSVYDLQNWLGSSVIYCYDCSGAGNIIKNFNDFVEKRKREEKQNPPVDGSVSAASYLNSIQIGACRADEILPMNPKLPADMFTCCITTPVEIAVKWFVMQYNIAGLDASTIVIPGKISDRRTPLGELNWIFTAITDTIAWSALDKDLFKRLFRQDLVVAAMFRNFLLAVRIMRVHNCHPVSSPALPDTHDHPLWASWDLTVNQCLLQLPAMIEAEKDGRPHEYEHSDFFEQQLTAFEVWLKYKSSEIDKPPEQLPILLQVLLSQIHRLRALLLLSRYLDLGPKAVSIALGIGFFIYVLKLLQSPAPELRPVLVFIWTRIMAVEYKDIQHELVKENGYTYFVSILVSPRSAPGSPGSTANSTEHLAMCAFVIAQFCRGFKQGQRLCAVPELFDALTNHMGERESPLLRQWACLCFSSIWEGCTEAKELASSQPDNRLIRTMVERLHDPIPEVRAAALTALTTYVDVADEKVAQAVIPIAFDGSPIMRKEVVVFFSKMVELSMSSFLVCAYTTVEEEYQMSKTGDFRSESPAHGSTWLAIWRILLALTVDPNSKVREYAELVVDSVFSKLAKSPLSHETEIMSSYLEDQKQAISVASMAPETMPQPPIMTGSPRPSLATSESMSFRPHRTISTHFELPSPVNQRSASVPIVDRPAMNGNSPKRAPLVDAALRYAKHWWNGDENGYHEPESTEAIKQDTGGHIRTPRVAGEDITEFKVRKNKQQLPLKSTFYDWSVEYFTEPQLHETENDEAGSQRQLERLWRKTRNEGILSDTQVQKDLAVTGSWNNPIATLKNVHRPAILRFAQFESQLVAGDHHDVVTVWDWQTGTRLNQFRNGNVTGTGLMDLKYINEDDQPLLLTAASDGMARVFRRFDTRDVELVSSWWLLADMLPQHKLSPLSIEWHQSRGTLMVGGDVRVIRMWDASRESVAEDLSVGTISRLTSLTTDQVTGNLCIAGFMDGGVHVYDRRLDKNSALVRKWKDHSSHIINVRMQRGGAREIVSGSWDGKVNLWDIRMSGPVTSFQAHTKEMRALDLHEHAPVIATASRVVGLWSTSGRRVSTIRNAASTFGTAKLSNVSTLSFHPHRVIMGVNSSADSTISIFECTP